jgi:hypothetical protein
MRYISTNGYPYKLDITYEDNEKDTFTLPYPTFCIVIPMTGTYDVLGEEMILSKGDILRYDEQTKKYIRWSK